MTNAPLRSVFCLSYHIGLCSRQKVVFNLRQAASLFPNIATLQELAAGPEPTRLTFTQVDESPVNAEIGRRAVELIAQARRSQYLRNWLETGEMAQAPMEPSEAYSILQIDDRAALLDDETLSALFGARVTEAPDREADFTRALAVVKADMETNRALHHDGGASRNQPAYPLEEWPVGLQNIGNTCYLNSLLQFFFTVEPLRRMVLNVDEYMMKLTDEMPEKRVGGGSVRRHEVERAQACKFVDSKRGRS